MRYLWLYELCSDIAYFFINIYIRVTRTKILIGRNARVNFKAKLEGYNKIERNSIFSGSLGKYSYIGANSLVVGSVGKFCSIGGNVTFLTSTHPTKDWITTHPAFYSLKRQCGITFTKRVLFDEYPLKHINQKHSIEIGNDVYIGFGATLIGPLTIGDGAIIAACSVVTKDVPPYTIVAGNPARFIKYRFDKETIAFIQGSKWWDNSEEWFETNCEFFKSFSSFQRINLDK